MSIHAMTAAEVTQRLVDGEQLFILDVRNGEEYENWRIEGKYFTSLNIPYFELLDGVDQLEGKLPQDGPILVACAKEGSSIFVAEQLTEAGYKNLFYLAGGMKQWSEQLYEKKVYEDGHVVVYQVIRVGKGCLSYLVISGDEMLIIDPSRFTQFYLDVAERLNVKITRIADSHLHADHISGGPALAQLTGATYYLMKSEGAVLPFEPLEQHEQIQFQQAELEVIALKTPGHTPGSVSFFLNQKLLFSGDTIFISGLGRPDLGGQVQEWAEQLYDTVYTKVAEIADDVLVLPAHYANLQEEMNEQGYIGAALGSIRQRNQEMFNTDKETFLERVEESASHVKPPNFTEIVSINRGVLEHVDEERLTELEIGPNRCAIGGSVPH